MQDQTLIRLVEAVEAVGGELLPETHHPMPYVFKVPGPAGRVKKLELFGTGCHQDTVFRVPYDHIDMDKAGVDTGQPERHDVKVCAVDDRMDLWPRFTGAAA